MATKFSNSDNPYVAERIVQDSLLLPDSGADLELMDELADRAVTRGANTDDFPYFQACKAMAHLRLGNFSEAVEWGGKSATSSVDFARAKAYAIVAMAHWRLGQKDEARHALAEGDALAPPISRKTGVVDLGESWVAWLMARISLDEAAKLIHAVGENSQF